jgi:hypothetical protein
LNFLSERCTFKAYDESILKSCKKFDCNHLDLNDFFANDALEYSSELLGKSYCFVLDEDPQIIVCAFTISNDSIKTTNLPNGRKKKIIKCIPRVKHMRSYPAVLIGRLGVNKDFRNICGETQRTGDQLMDFIKSWFVDIKNKTGCRFIVVDSYNESNPLRYYLSNGFEYLFSTEDQEREYTGTESHVNLKTRLMYYDLILLKP